jgi:hypothetical protein
MPWSPIDAERHTQSDDTNAESAGEGPNERLENTGDEGRAIREANAVTREFEHN